MPPGVRERLHHTLRTGTPFLGVLDNRRYLGGGCWESFQNMLHMVVVFAGDRSYVLGLQVDVSGLNLDLTDGSQDATRIQMMFDSVLGAGADSWINSQEGAYHAAPLYLYIRHAGDNSADQVAIVEAQASQMQQVPDQYLVLSPQFSPLALSIDPFHLDDQTEPQERSPDLGSLKWPPDKPAPTSPADETSKQSTRHQGYDSLSRPSAAQAGNVTGASSTAADHDDQDPLLLPLHSVDREQATRKESTDSVTPTMKTQLQALDLEDPMTVLIARGVSKLGLEAGDVLRDYFGAYGLVKAVHVPYTFKKCGYKKRKPSTHGAAGAAALGGRETRAPGRCFIVMSTAAERNQILEHASEYMVQDVKVTLEPFAAKPDEALEENKISAKPHEALEV